MGHQVGFRSRHFLPFSTLKRPPTAALFLIRRSASRRALFTHRPVRPAPASRPPGPAAGRGGARGAGADAAPRQGDPQSQTPWALPQRPVPGGAARLCQVLGQAGWLLPVVTAPLPRQPRARRLLALTAASADTWEAGARKDPARSRKRCQDALALRALLALRCDSISISGQPLPPCPHGAPPPPRRPSLLRGVVGSSLCGIPTRSCFCQH